MNTNINRRRSSSPKWLRKKSRSRSPKSCSPKSCSPKSGSPKSGSPKLNVSIAKSGSPKLNVSIAKSVEPPYSATKLENRLKQESNIVNTWSSMINMEEKKKNNNETLITHSKNKSNQFQND
jgi:hypothetical protein